MLFKTVPDRCLDRRIKFQACTGSELSTRGIGRSGFGGKIQVYFARAAVFVRPSCYLICIVNDTRNMVTGNCD